MHLPATALLLASAIVVASAPAMAGEVFQWKDAQGVTHYSESPPPSGAYEQRVIGDGGQAQVAKPVETTKTASAETAQCTRARANLETLQAKTNVQMDSDGDGKADKTLNDTDRANQLELAHATIKATCANSATPAKS